MVDNEVLAGSRVLLRMPRIQDAERLFSTVTSDPAVTEFLSWQPHSTVDETRRVIGELFNVGNDTTWAVVLRHGDEVIGQLGCRRISGDVVEMGYCMATRFWGRGLLSEAVEVALQWLQQDPQLARVTAACHVRNVRSVRVLEKCGFVLQGRHARHTVFPNLDPQAQDCLVYTRALREAPSR
jgi:ribosomal-protein-alanine N-acetyltransferase